VGVEALQRGPGSITLRLAMALAGALGLLALVDQFEVLQDMFEPVNLALARTTVLVLEYMDVPVSRHGSVLAHPDGFSYRITYVCSGLRPVALIAVTLMLVPAPWFSRLSGLAIAIGGVAALNLCRLVHLYCTGVADRDAFFVAHRVTWNIIAVLAVVGFLALWLKLTCRHAPREPPQSSSCHAYC
jgi:exosortase/archaeosortase family protein